MGIRTKLVITMVALAFSIGTAPLLYSVEELQRSVYQEFQSRGAMVTRQLAATLGDMHDLMDSIHDAGSLQKAGAELDIIVAYVLDSDGWIISDGSSRNFRTDARLPQFDLVRNALSQSGDVVARLDDDVMHHSGSIISDGQPVGFVHIVMSMDRADRIVFEHLRTQAAIFAVALILGVGLSYLIAGSLSRPVRRMLHITSAIKNGNFQVRVPVRSRDELGRLAVSINEMASSLRSTTVSKRYLDEVLQSMVDSLVVVDTDANIVTVNRATVEMLSYTEEQLVGQPASMICIDEGYQLTGKRLRHLLGETTQQDHELMYRTATGAMVPISFSGSPICDHDGNVVGYVCIGKDITERKRAEEERESLNRQLVKTSRQAGMAEVATDVLHNVGNVLNSINISASLLTDTVRTSKASGLVRAAELIQDHSENLATFLEEDEKGRQLPEYLSQLAEHLTQEQAGIVEEVQSLTQNVNHIKDIISMQQSYAKVAGVIETVSLRDVIKESLRLNESSIARHRVRVRQELHDVPDVMTDKHKVLQILVNLVANAKDATDANPEDARIITVRLFVDRDDAQRVTMEIADNGHGIEPDHMNRIFKHGFTTKKHGHGFGLHSSALTAKELRGSLTVRSDGPGTGATFAFTLPLQYSETKR